MKKENDSSVIKLAVKVLQGSLIGDMIPPK